MTDAPPDPPDDRTVKFTGSLGDDRIIDGEIRLADNAKLTNEAGEQIGTIESIERVDGDLHVTGTVPGTFLRPDPIGDRSLAVVLTPGGLGSRLRELFDRAEPKLDPALCNEAFSRCRCVKPAGHTATDPDHGCDPRCGGSWRPDPTSVWDEEADARMGDDLERGIKPTGPLAMHGVIALTFPDPDLGPAPGHRDVGNPYDPDKARGAPYGTIVVPRGPISYYPPPPLVPNAQGFVDFGPAPALDDVTNGWTPTYEIDEETPDA